MVLLLALAPISAVCVVAGKHRDADRTISGTEGSGWSGLVWAVAWAVAWARLWAGRANSPSG